MPPTLAKLPSAQWLPPERLNVAHILNQLLLGQLSKGKLNQEIITDLAKRIQIVTSEENAGLLEIYRKKILKGIELSSGGIEKE